MIAAQGAIDWILVHPRRRLILQPALFRIARKGLAGLAILLGPFFVKAAGADEPSTAWKFHDGDRIVLVGDTLIERDQRHGYLETFLTIANPDLNLTFRNLGWSGDTVRGLSRAGFDPPEAGFRALKEQILAAQPTVLIIGYGMADSFDGAAGLPRFVSGLNELLDAVAATRARLILLSPIAHEDLGPLLPDPTAHNRDLERYAEAIRSVARERKARFVELLDVFPIKDQEGPHSEDGIHLTERGYRELGRAICLRLGQYENLGKQPTVAIRGDGTIGDAGGRQVTELKASTRGLRFVVQNKVLSASPDLCWRFPGLAPGQHILTIDGKAVAKASASEWSKGNEPRSSPDRDQLEKLRKTINAKNTLFFYRWRPQNITYLFGFRKHEQGNNAVEIPQFDPLVEAREKEIARLKKPLPHVYELIRESEVAK